MLNEFEFENCKELNGPAVEMSKRLCREAKFLLPIDMMVQDGLEFTFVNAKKSKQAEIAA